MHKSGSYLDTRSRKAALRSLDFKAAMICASNFSFFRYLVFRLDVFNGSECLISTLSVLFGLKPLDEQRLHRNNDIILHSMSLS